MVITKNIFWIIPVLIVGVFLLEYNLIINYIENTFLYNEEIKNEVLAKERSNFYMNITKKGVFMVLQFIACVVSINIGLLFFNYKITIKKIVKIVMQSFIALLIIQLIIVVFIWSSNLIISINNIEIIEDKLYLINYLNTDNIATYLIMPLQTFNVTHLLYVLILTHGISITIKKNLYIHFLS